MASTASRRVEDPVHKASYSFEPDGENLWVHTWLEDGGHLPEHFHPSLEERWEVLEGVARVKLDAAREGLYNARNLPTSVRGLLWAAELSQRFRHETVMCSPPPAVQRLLMPPLAPLARRRAA